MTRIMGTSLLCAALAAGVAAPGQIAHKTAEAETPYRITGTLVSTVDGSPVPHGHLLATLVGTGVQQGRRSALENTFDADDEGRFVVVVPSAGMWNLTAWGRGFVRNAYLGHEEFSSGIVLTREHPAMDLQFALAPQAVIKGMVLDEAGEAVRNAHVTLFSVQAATPDRMQQASGRIGAQTDDRGIYEFDGLQPGIYKLCITAQPWYAVAAEQGRRGDNAPPLDPSLDVVYPVTWFPGVDSRDAAETLTLKGGDVREADFHLRPEPALHILVNPLASTAEGTPRAAQYSASVQRIDSGVNYFRIPQMERNAQGQIDIGGLTPGLYQVQLNGPRGTIASSIVRMTADGSQTVNIDNGSGEAETTLHLDGIPPDEANAVTVMLLYPETGRVIAAANPVTPALRPAVVTASDAATPVESPNDAKKPERTLHAPPGRYEVAIVGRQNVYLTGITAKGAEASGRMVSLPAGVSSLTLHVAKNHAELTGIVTRDGKPSVGALVMLVPATLGEPGAIQIVRRDQSNTDGSFDIAGVIPGQYILIAVEDGWDINWKDKATLTRYLDGGVAVNLSTGGSVTQNISAERP